MNRAYSLLEIKSIDEDDRVIEGIATTPSTDRMEDIIEPKGAAFKLPLPLLWQHDHKSPIGSVEFDTPTEDGITFSASIPVITEPGKLQDMVEMAWQAIRYRLVRAVSIGFRALEYSWMDNGGIRFIQSEVYELSAVTIPAQPDALISAVKSFDAALRREAGIPDLEIPLRPEPAAIGTKGRVVMLNEPVRARTDPFVLRSIIRTHAK